MKRPADAVAVLREAIAAIDGSGKPELAAESGGLRERLSILLYRSGHAEAADQAFPPPADSGPAATRRALPLFQQTIAQRQGRIGYRFASKNRVFGKRSSTDLYIQTSRPVTSQKPIFS